LDIPNSVTNIGDSAFNDCTGLTSFTIPNTVTSIAYNTFRNCTGLTSVSIPSSVTSIGDYAFRSCTGLTSISIPNSVISIGVSTFRDCSGLTSVSIPNSVTNIGDNSFRSCTGLTSVTVKWANPLVINTTIFRNVDITQIPLTAPSISLYSAAAVWQDFASISLSTDDFIINAIDIELYPNPTKDILNVRLNNYDFEGLTIYNSLGQSVLESEKTQVNISALATGIYHVVVKTAEGSGVKKLMIQ